MADSFESLWNADGSQPSGGSASMPSFDDLWESTPIEQPAALSLVPTINRPSIGQAAEFVGRKGIQGLAGVVDFADFLNPFRMLQPQRPIGLVRSSVDSIFGDPYKETGIAKTPASEVIGAGIEGAVFPGGPVANAAVSMGAEAGRLVDPDSWLAPIIGAGTTALSLAGLSKGSKSALNWAKGLDRASLGTQARDYARSIKTKGVFEDQEVQQLSTRLARAIDDIAQTEGLGVIRSPDALLSRSMKALDESGKAIGTTLKALDDASVSPIVKFEQPGSNVAKLIGGAKAEKADLKKAFDEFFDRFTDPIDGWDGSAAGLNSWKSSIGNMGFSGSAQGTLKPAVARKLQRAIYGDIAESLDDAVKSSGVADYAAWKESLKRFSNHSELLPVLQPELAKELASTWDKVSRGLLRTSGGTLTTPTIIGTAAVGGFAGPMLGLLSGVGLAALGSPTGRGLTASALKAGSKVGGALSKGAASAPLAALSQHERLFGQKTESPPAFEDAPAETPESKAFDNLILGTNDQGLFQGASMSDEPISDNLLDAVRQVESGGGKYLKSKAGALGPYQFMPATAKSYGLADPMDETTSRDAARRLLADELEALGDIRLALASYNAGRPRVLKAIERAGSRNWEAVARELLKMGLRETAEYIPKYEKLGVI